MSACWKGESVLHRRTTAFNAFVVAAIVWGAAVVALVVVTDWPVWVDWLIAGTATTFLYFAFDKVQAKRAGRRIPEAVLLTLVLIGGVIGGWAGMLGLRHKTRHRRFWAMQWVGTVGWIGVMWVAIVGF